MDYDSGADVVWVRKDGKSVMLGVDMGINGVGYEFRCLKGEYDYGPYNTLEWEQRAYNPLEWVSWSFCAGCEKPHFKFVDYLCEECREQSCPR